DVFGAHRALASFPTRRSSDLMVVAAQRTVPILIGLMAYAFVTYLMLKGVSKIWKVDFLTASIFGALAGFAVWVFMARSVQAKTRSEEHTSELQSRENLVCRLL